MSLGMVGTDDTKETTLGGVKYKLKKVNREQLSKIMGFSSFRSGTQEEYVTNLETAVIAWAIQTIDGASKEEVFAIPFEVEGKKLTWLQRRDMANEKMYHFLNTNENEFTQALIVFYEQEFPNINLLGSGKVYALCPEPNCTFKKIVDRDEEAYCTVHGVKLVRETDLPNPSRPTR